jgi:formate dehydrogenase iron-sulfur subunit
MFPPIPNPSVQPLQAAFGEQDLVRRSASTEVPRPARQLTPVAKLIDVSKCIGCKACQAACLEWNDLREEVGYNHGVLDNPLDLTPDSLTVMRFTEWINPATSNLEWLIRKDGCMHCGDPGCLKACPAPGAIVQYSNGIVDFIHENCIGCGYCVKGCPFNIPRISQVDNKAYKCTLCSDRIAVGQGPACQKACPTQAIVFGTKDEMKQWAGERIRDLKSRGFDKAGLYDPPGVGGTHVMYVLHHADQPQIYAGLPANPTISRLVEAWKGAGKYAGLALIGLTAAASVLHYLMQGPNTVTEQDEARADALAEAENREEDRR